MMLPCGGGVAALVIGVSCTVLSKTAVGAAVVAVVGFASRIQEASAMFKRVLESTTPRSRSEHRLIPSTGPNYVEGKSGTTTPSSWGKLSMHLTWWVLTLALMKAGMFSGIHVMKQ